MFWPRMSVELKEYILKCDVCMAHCTTQVKEPISQHEFAARPWSKVGADLCEFQRRTLLVVCDYYSNYIWVEDITRANAAAISKALKEMFARYGVPDVLVSDNGPQFASEEFASFAKKWGFEHITSSPHYPQSNGKAKNAVKTVKRLFTKCQESGQSEFLALLDWRNTPTEGLGTSPAQRFLGRRCKTLLPVTGSLLQPDYPTEKIDKLSTNKNSVSSITTINMSSSCRPLQMEKLYGCVCLGKRVGVGVSVRGWLAPIVIVLKWARAHSYGIADN